MQWPPTLTFIWLSYAVTEKVDFHKERRILNFQLRNLFMNSAFHLEKIIGIDWP